MKAERLLFFVIIISSIYNFQSWAADYSHLKNLHAPGRIDGKPAWIKCPDWDWDLIPAECKNLYMISVNCLSRCGKFPGDKPDIGAWEYYPGITPEKPWGDWNGIPQQNKHTNINTPKNFKGRILK